MKYFSLKAIIVVLCVLSVCASVGHYMLGELTGNATRMRVYQLLHEKSYKAVAEALLGVDAFQMVRISVGMFPVSDSLNSCGHEKTSSVWRCYLPDGGVEGSIIFETLPQVMSYVGLSRAVLEPVQSFMKTYHIDTVLVNHNAQYVDFMDKGVGLRYYASSTEAVFTPDEEYQMVKPLGNQWFYFITDWN